MYTKIFNFSSSNRTTEVIKDKRLDCFTECHAHNQQSSVFAFEQSNEKLDSEDLSEKKNKDYRVDKKLPPKIAKEPLRY